MQRASRGASTYCVAEWLCQCRMPHAMQELIDMILVWPQECIQTRMLPVPHVMRGSSRTVVQIMNVPV